MYDFANPVRESARSLSCVLRTDCKKIVPVLHCTCKHVSSAEEKYNKYFIYYNVIRSEQLKTITNFVIKSNLH